MKNLHFLLTLCLFTGLFTGCGNDDKDDITQQDLCALTVYNDRIEAAFENFSAAVNAYVAAPTSANCEAYRSAARDYLATIKEFETCTTIAERDDFRQSLREAEEAVADITC